MSALEDLIKQVDDERLRARLLEEAKKATKHKKFGLVFEEHLPECTPLYDLPIKKGSTVAKKLPKHLDYRVIGMARNLFALPALIVILSVMYAVGQPFTFRPTTTAWLVLGYTGFLKYGLAMVVWYKAIRALDLSKVTAIYLSYPVLSLLLSAALGLDHITPHQIAGLLISCAGAYWVSLTVQKEGH